MVGPARGLRKALLDAATARAESFANEDTSMRIIPNNGTGARVLDADLSRPLNAADFDALLQALGRHGVLHIPGQDIEAPALSAFGSRFGTLEVNVANMFHAPSHPEVMILSNKKDANGKPIGLGDAGQGWHTDMSYSSEIALANVLHAKEVPLRDGVALGATQFLDMHAACADLPAEIRARIEGRRALHDFEKFWDMVRVRPGSLRPPLTPEQRAKKPPVWQPIIRRHPITGRDVLYCNPGYATRIEGLEAAESVAILEFLFRHQMQAKYLYSHAWAAGDVLMWDNIGTIHNAVADYAADEPRYILRVQVMADRYAAELAA
jgi:taurine dioxygenase